MDLLFFGFMKETKVGIENEAFSLTYVAVIQCNFYYRWHHTYPF